MLIATPLSLLCACVVSPVFTHIAIHDHHRGFWLFAGIQDPIREEVPGAVHKCQNAGITVRMVTGDNKQTACSIAEKAGIFQKEVGLAMEGIEFRQMAEEQPERLASLLPRLQVCLWIFGLCSCWLFLLALHRDRGLVATGYLIGKWFDGTE